LVHEGAQSKEKKKKKKELNMQGKKNLTNQVAQLITQRYRYKIGNYTVFNSLF
jgi:hypothetical protein